MSLAGILFCHDPYYGIYVANLVQGSPAHRCGSIALGDRLVAIDGAPVVAPHTAMADISRGVQGAPGTTVLLSFARAAAGALRRPLIRVDVLNTSVGF